MRISPCDWGGIEVFDDRDTLPVYFSPEVLAACFVGMQVTAAGQTRLDQVITDRLATREIEQNMQEVLA